MSYDFAARRAPPDMTPSRSRHLWLLALTLVVGQWLAVVHGIQHELNAGAQLVACETCAVGHATAGPPLARLLPTLPAPSFECPAVISRIPLSRPSLQVPPPRGPPSRLV